MIPSQPILRVQGISKHFGGVTALSQVTFDLEPGLIGGIIGPNGAGKTSLFNALTGLYTADEGTILFGDPPTSLIGLRQDQVAAKGVVRSFQSIKIGRAHV